MRPLRIYIDGYFDSNEGKILDKVKFNAKTVKEVMSGFGRLGYRYEGIWHWTNKDINGFCWDEFEKVFEKIAKIQEKYFGKVKYNYHVVDVWIGRDKNGKERTPVDCPGMCSANGDEKVVRLKDKDNKGKTRDYYCFWNPSEKYYYLIEVHRNSGFIGGWHDFIPAFEGWITIKTRSVADIEAEYAKTAEELRAKREQAAKEAEERRKKEEHVKKIKQEYKDLKNAVHEYWKKHKDEFKKVDWEDLPQQARDDFKLQHDAKTDADDEKIVRDCTYFRYYVGTGGDPGYDYYDVLVADRDFKNCFYYETQIRNKWSLD